MIRFCEEGRDASRSFDDPTCCKSWELSNVTTELGVNIQEQVSWADLELALKRNWLR
jgi:hypothetical protein